MRSPSSNPETGEIIVMEQFRTGKSLGPIKQAEAYWTSLRTGVDVPRRSDIDPRGIDNLLEYAFIIERIAPGVARFRLAGQHLSALMGMDVRGMPLTALFSPQARAHAGTILEQVFDTPAVAELTLKTSARRGRAPCEARMLILPLRSDTGEVTRALGVLVSDGSVSNVPARFDVTDTAIRPTNGQALAEVPSRPDNIKLSTPPAAQAFEPVRQPAASQTTGTSEPKTPTMKKRPAYLRVVK